MDAQSPRAGLHEVTSTGWVRGKEGIRAELAQYSTFGIFAAADNRRIGEIVEAVYMRCCTHYPRKYILACEAGDKSHIFDPGIN